MVIHVHLDVNKSGIFNGSCILELKNREDMQVVLDNCKHKYIGGRLIRADVCHESKFKPDKPIHSSVVYGLKLRDVPCVISDDQIRGLFPEKSLTGLSSKLGSDSATTRNVRSDHGISYFMSIVGCC
ncbi:unnamed protein product [Heterobilharzia americana]|nr:unnamed protein product [Heterobilharzia americana]